MVLFEGLKAILSVWDTVAPISTEVRPDGFVPPERVVESGPSELGRWHSERQDVRAYYRRPFE